MEGTLTQGAPTKHGWNELKFSAKLIWPPRPFPWDSCVAGTPPEGGEIWNCLLLPPYLGTIVRPHNKMIRNDEILNPETRGECHDEYCEEWRGGFLTGLFSHWTLGHVAVWYLPVRRWFTPSPKFGWLNQIQAKINRRCLNFLPLFF